MKAKLRLSLYAEYSSRLTTLKIPTTVNPDTKLVSAVAHSSRILEHVSSCVGKSRGIKKYQCGNEVSQFDACKAALSQRTLAQVAFPKLLVWP